VLLTTNHHRGQQPERRENFHHEGREGHEEKILNSNFEMSPLRVLRVLRGEEYFAQALKTFNYVNRNTPNSTQKFVGCAQRTVSPDGAQAHPTGSRTFTAEVNSSKFNVQGPKRVELTLNLEH
jgi:hypothetical protein